MKTSLLDPESDTVQIGDKRFIKDSGVEKLAFAYNLNDEILREEKEDDKGRTVWRMWVRVTAPNGRQSTDVGAASSDERKFAHPDHDVYSLCHTRARNRAIIGILGLGEISFEEMSPIAPDQKPEPVRVWNVPAARDDHHSQEISGYPISNGNKTVGVAYVNTTTNEISLIPEPPVKIDSGPVQGFLVAKFLEPLKKKHPSEFDYELRSSNSQLTAVLVKCKLEEQRLKELLNAAGWTFDKAAETKTAGGAS